MKNVLIIGGCGFVGRRFTRRLLDDGWRVTVVDDLSAGIPYERWAFKSNYEVNLMRYCGAWAGNLRNWLERRNVEPDDFDLIIHCAAVVGGRLKIDGDPLAVATDLAIDADFFNWVVKAKSKPKVIYFSSSAVYPIELQNRAKHCAMSEGHVAWTVGKIGVPDMTYGWAKLTGELLAQHAVQTYNADVVIYRPFSGYGEDQSFDYPFPSIIRRVVNRENPITIWGSGEQTRDFIYIEDIIDAVLETKDKLKPGEVLNLGTGVATSFMDLAFTAAKTLKCWNDHVEDMIPRVQLACDTTKPEGVFYRVADTYKLSQFYTPKVSLEEGIRKVADHMRKH